MESGGGGQWVNKSAEVKLKMNESAESTRGNSILLFLPLRAKASMTQLDDCVYFTLLPSALPKLPQGYTATSRCLKKELKSSKDTSYPGSVVDCASPSWNIEIQIDRNWRQYCFYLRHFNCHNVVAEPSDREIPEPR